MVKKKKEIKNLEGNATFKQSWTIAHMFAEKSASLFPDYDPKKLARLFNGSIYYYHEKIGEKLSKEQASEMISNDPPVPRHYIDHLQSFLNNLKKEKSGSSNDNFDQSAVLELMKEDLKKQE